MNDPEQPEYGASGAYAVDDEGRVTRPRERSVIPRPPVPANVGYMRERDLEKITCDVILAGWVFHRAAIWSGLPYTVRWRIYCCLSMNPCGHLIQSSTGTGHIICPDALVRYYHHSYLNYQRLPVRGLVSRFEHPYNVAIMIPEMFFGRIDRQVNLVPRGIQATFAHDFVTPDEGRRYLSWAREDELRIRFLPLGPSGSRHPALQQHFLSRGRLHREHRYDSRRLSRIREFEPESPFQNFLGVTPAPDVPKGRGRARPHTERMPTAHDRCNRDVRGRVVVPVGQRPHRRPRPKNVQWQKRRQLGCRGK